MGRESTDSGAQEAVQHGQRSNTPEMIVGRYGELWLKGRNRGEFERMLVHNIRRALESLGGTTIQRAHSHLIIRPTARMQEAVVRLSDVFGLASLSPAWRARRDAEHIAQTAEHVLGRALRAYPAEKTIRFRVKTTRADKSFPMLSTELDRYVADRAMAPFHERLRVDLGDPELTLSIRVQPKGAYVFAQTLPGAGGLPVGTLGRVMCLLSGGIDSPVAAWMAMKRGCRVSFVTFHSYPFLGESAKAKVLRIARELMRFQPRASFYCVPFAEIQTAIRDHCREKYRTVLYRRMMQRIAARLATAEGAQALITGESLGQVASQTLENMVLIGSASALPVLRPLVAFDKGETIARARTIGTFELSIQPEPDCCTVFQPQRPVIRGRADECAAEEAQLEVEALVKRAIDGVERRALP